VIDLLLLGMQVFGIPLLVITWAFWPRYEEAVLLGADPLRELRRKRKGDGR
jgi:hypothetical protein